MTQRLVAGRYALREQLGRALWHAEDTELAREVAVRLPVPDERTSAAAARLAHPNIVRLFDHGEDGGDRFEVLEYVPGETLAARLERGDLSEADRARLGSEIRGALAYAHAAGIGHGSLTAESVLLDESGAAKLVGFGGVDPAGDEADAAALLGALKVPQDEASTRIIPPAAVQHAPQRRRRRLGIAIAAALLALAGGIAAAFVVADSDSPSGAEPTDSSRIESITTAGSTAQTAPAAPSTSTEQTTSASTEETTPTTTAQTTAPPPTAPSTAPLPTAPLPTEPLPTEPVLPPTTIEEPPLPPTTVEETTTFPLP